MSTEGLRDDAARWFAQADDDLQAGGVLIEAGHFALGAFHAQQAAEKALKGLWRSLDLDPWGRSCVRLVEELPGSTEPVKSHLRPLAAALDKLYIPTRYPDALPGITPAQAYTRGEGLQAIAQARRVIELVVEAARL